MKKVESEFDLERYLTGGVENIVKGAIKATLSNPRESVFMAGYARSSKVASKKRRQAEEGGKHIPPFLIASITSKCNLHCAGCYARSNQACVDGPEVGQLTDGDWKKIFLEAKDLGIGFILLAGGEPMLRKGVLEEAGKISEILFPIFTNGTMMPEDYIKLLDKHRNLVPIISLEGGKEKTNARRGTGVYEILMETMDRMRENGILFGASITVTTENIKEVTSDAFLQEISRLGCKAVVYVEFVPVTQEVADLAPGDEERAYLDVRLRVIREEREDMVFISFPGDEKSSGGCLAAGRGFFHINSQGGAEPCPFSPYSDCNVKDSSLSQALESKLFQRLGSEEILMGDHKGGCVLFEKREQVESMMEKSIEKI